jgi:hypothetical protein
MTRLITTILSSFPAIAFMLLPLSNAGNTSDPEKFQSLFVINDPMGNRSYYAEMELIY